jgi:hypothetical protein
MVSIDRDDDIQSDTPYAIPRGVLRQRGGDVRDTRREVHPHRRMAEVASVHERTRLRHPAVIRLPSAPPRMIAELSYVKLRLPEPDVNGRFNRRDNLRFSKGDTEHTEQRADHGAVALRLHSLGQQQARPGAIRRHGRAILSFDGSHIKNLPVYAVDTSSYSSRTCVTMLPLQTARAYAEGHV